MALSTSSHTAYLYELGDATVAVTLHEPSLQADVPEALVQALWRDQRFDRSTLQTTTGTPIIVHDPGTINTDSGPDFLDAHLQIGDMTWQGAVEIHTTSGDWFTHRHHEDPRYNSVVLHVTLRVDTWTGGLLRADQTTLPELVLSPRLQRPLRRLLHQYRTQAETDLLCESHWTSVPDAVRTPWLERLAEERIQEKTARLGEQFQTGLTVDQLLYERLFAGLGYAKNDTAMEMLTRRLPLDLLRALDDPLDREALAFGVADLLPAPGDLLDSDRATADYVMDLRARFRRLRTHHPSIPSMKRAQWTFFRLRPANFPPLRIAQGLAWLVPDGLLHAHSVDRLLDALRAESPVDTLRTVLHTRPNDFWTTHLRLAKPTTRRDPSLGRTRTDTLIINAVLPYLLLIAEQRSMPDVKQRVMDVLRTLPPPRDTVVRTFKALGTRPASAFDAQGLHQLYRSYCQPGRCLSCAVGQHVLDA